MMWFRAFCFSLFLLSTSAVAAPGLGEAGGISNNTPAAITKGIGFDQHPGTSIPMDLEFNDETGTSVPIGRYFSRGPVVLAMVYYGCPNLCTMVIDGLFKALLELPFKAGEKYSVVLVGIDPTETSTLAAEKKKNYLTKRYRKAGADAGIHFLTGTDKNIKTLAQTVGFRYRYDAKEKEYAHPAGVMVLTPEGKLSRYLYGIEYAGRDLKFALMEASEEKIGSPVDKFLLLCYHYDPAQGTYSKSILGGLRVTAALTLAGVVFGIGFMLLQEKKRRRQGNKSVSKS